MKRKLLDYLRCPSCAGAILLAAVASSEDAEIMEGRLACDSCQRTYPIVRGIPRFGTPEKLEADKAATAENFGWQWQHFVQSDELYADQFLAWIAPVSADFFHDKLVLEGGCGKGRHTQLAANWGAREVIGVDLSEAVETAFVAKYIRAVGNFERCNKALRFMRELNFSRNGSTKRVIHSLFSAP